MIVHIIRNESISKEICTQLAYYLCDKYDAIVRIINNTDIDTILSESSSDYNIYIEKSSGVLKIKNEDDLHIYILDTSTLDDIVNICNFDSIIPKDILQPTYWCKNEKGWWYKIERSQYMAADNNVMVVNGKWYYIGNDYYMKTGWLPVTDENGENLTCLYFNPEDGSLDYERDKSDMPDPLGFSFKPAIIKI